MHYALMHKTTFIISHFLQDRGWVQLNWVLWLGLSQDCGQGVGQSFSQLKAQCGRGSLPGSLVWWLADLSFPLAVDWWHQLPGIFVDLSLGQLTIWWLTSIKANK